MYFSFRTLLKETWVAGTALALLISFCPAGLVKAEGHGIKDSSGGAKLRPSAVNDSNRTKRHWVIAEKGFLTGYGFGINQQSVPEGSYSPIFLMGQFGIPFPRLGTGAHSPGPVSLIFEPQFNIVLLRGAASTRTTYEGGIGIGLQQVFTLSTHFRPFIRIVAGPHYFSAHTTLQHRGFLFSDNVAAGFYYYLTPRLALQAQFRARHMSNANLLLPNHGINTSNFLGGLSWFI